MSRPGDLNLSKRLMASSTSALLAFMAAGVFGGRTIYSQNKITETPGVFLRLAPIPPTRREPQRCA